LAEQGANGDSVGTVVAWMLVDRYGLGGRRVDDEA
jgi:hypothetical protein